MVIESKNIGQGYASLSMLDPTMEVKALEAELTSAMEGVVTVEITRAVRDTTLIGVNIEKDSYISIVGKEILSSTESPIDTVVATLEKIGFGDYCACIVLCGADAREEDVGGLEAIIGSKFPNQEAYIVDGGQNVYNYILIVS